MGVTRHRYVVDGWGMGEVWTDGRVLVAHELLVSAASVPGASSELAVEDMARDNATSPPMGGSTSPTGTLAQKSSQKRADFVQDLCRRFQAHLRGARAAYDDVAVDDGWCTPFQRELLGALRAVPWGEVVTYGELAALAGRPGAARAAGSFCAGNRFSLVVPCHRVVAADAIGGYGASGVGLKRRLLALEGVEV